ncbi:amidase domain-containing protein [Lentibacillus cibarius]|uniref:Amidase domain-containing protein n=1 Tax=Lentibacillus cibarius TaxID=2583219 RepID=A0A5S3QM75_9BACI|nr:amidase domain-containing protein [Lentibacillus cibarius]TMN22990.1 amidase domain-containing protein [Lentibacillus cibarius]
MEEIKDVWVQFFQSERNDQMNWWQRKKEVYRDRGAEIVRVSGKGQAFETIRYDNRTECQYLLHMSFLIKQGDHFIREEQVIPLRFQLEDGQVTEHRRTEMTSPKETTHPSINATGGHRSQQRFSYDRRAAVQYAERWWNSYNPAYRTFDVDCTNYVSQCMRAGGAPMRGAPDRSNGWWYKDDNWSYSWAVAHSLRWYLSGSTTGLKGKELESASELIPGDIICYDFEGDGRWDHNTIVVAKDADGMPLVNAHTNNSRHRYWSYEDSLAWTSDTRYKFFRIGE